MNQKEINRILELEAKAEKDIELVFA